MEVGLPSADTDADIVTRIAMLTLRGPNPTLEPTGLGLDHHRDDRRPAAQRERWLSGTGGESSRWSVGKPKRKLTAQQRAAKKRWREEYTTIFIRGKQKRARRPPIDGITEEEFVRNKADDLWYHQNEMWDDRTGRREEVTARLCRKAVAARPGHVAAQTTGRVALRPARLNGSVRRVRQEEY